MIIAVQNMRDIASFAMVQAQYHVFIMSIVTLVMNCRFGFLCLFAFFRCFLGKAFKIAVVCCVAGSQIDTRIIKASR